MTALLVANHGGHIMQLHSLSKRLKLPEQRVWVTTATAQTESLLAGETVHWVSSAPTRDAMAVARNARLVRPLFNQYDFEITVSTGSSLALSVLPQARLRGIKTCYIESATRAVGPSVTGKALAAIPGIKLYTQHRQWASTKWQYLGSVFDRFQVAARAATPVRKAVVSLGTSERYFFPRMLERLCKIIPDDVEVLWQTGATDCGALPIVGQHKVPNAQLRQAMRDADVVIAHAGTGIALTALECGKLPVLIPRRPEFNEHVDDHQLQIAADLAQRGLGVVREVEDLSSPDLDYAAAHHVIDQESTKPQLTW